MLSCVKDEEKNTPYGMCHDVKIVGGFLPEKINPICLNFYGEAKKSECMKKTRFCDMCCGHFVGIKHLDIRIVCIKKCKATLKKSGVTGTTVHHKTTSHKTKPYVFKSVPERPNTGCVIVFEKPLFLGKGLQVCSNSKEIKSFQTIWTKPIGSAKVGDSTIADLFENPKYKGRQIHTTADIPNFPLHHYTYKIQSIKINSTPKEGCAIFYTKTNFNGKASIICSKYGNTSNSFHGKIKSIKVNPKTTTVIYQKKNLLGRRLRVRRNDKNLNQRGFNTVWSYQNYPKPSIGCVNIFSLTISEETLDNIAMEMKLLEVP